MPDPTVPIVDFSLFESGTEDQKKNVARQIDDAFQNVGFVYLTNHGVAEALVSECFEWSKKFFALPHETKMLAPHPPGGSHHRGYSAPGVEKVSQHEYEEGGIDKLREIPDFKESFESGNPTDASQPNIWPPDEKLPGFQPFLESYFTACAHLIHRILSALSLALHIPAPGLPPTHSQSLFQLRLLHYPPLPASDLRDKKRERIAAHSDFGTLTLLWQDGVGGLEIEDPRGEEGVWRGVQAVRGGVLVNVGDLMSRWSNGRWRSTVHRVGLPPKVSDISASGQAAGGESRGGEEEILPARYSIPFFATADPETLIEALPGCWDEGGRPKLYEAVTAGGYVRMRMEALYQS